MAIQTSGPVVTGRKVENRLPRIDFFATGPEDGASPTDIVTGFLRAAADFQKDHLAARSFLSPDSRTTWRPDSPVLIYREPPTFDPATGRSGSPSGGAWVRYSPRARRRRRPRRRPASWR